MRAILVALILLTLPTSAVAQTCAGAGPATLCIDEPQVPTLPDPLVVDGGSMTAENGTLRAQAQGGLVLVPARAARIEIDVAIVQSADELHRYIYSAALYADGALWKLEQRQVWLGVGEHAETLVLELPAGTFEASVQSAALFLDLHDQVGWNIVGHASSSAPLLTAIVPDPTPHAARTPTVATRIDVASANVSRETAEAHGDEGALAVPAGTGVTLVATAAYDLAAIEGDFYYVSEDATMRFEAWLPNGVYYAVWSPVHRSDCWGECSVDAFAGQQTLEIAVPGDLEAPVGEVRFRLDVVSQTYGLQYAGDVSASAGATAEGTLLVVAPVG